MFNINSFSTITHRILSDIEGGYSNRANDKGGETYNGISRKYHPSWEGWAVIDSYKSSDMFPKILDSLELLHKMVLNFYKDKFWDNINGDNLSDINFDICSKLYEQCINFGIKKPSEWLQETLNLLNRAEKYYKNIMVDGDIGKVTIETLRKALKYNPDKRILTLMRCFQGNEYIRIMRANEKQEVNVGWIDRITL